MFWEIPAIDKKVDELVDNLSFSGYVKFKLGMSREAKDARVLYNV